MDTGAAQNLALDLEGEELIGEGDRQLSAEDIRPVIEALWERGADFRELLVADEAGPGERAIDAVSED